MISRIALFIFFQWTIVGCGFSQETVSVQDQVALWRGRINDNQEVDLLGTLVKLQKQSAIVEQLVPELTKLLKEGSEPVRRQAVRCLNQVGTKASPAVASLLPILDHRDYLVRSEVMQTLKAIGPVAAPELTEALKSPSPRIRACALSTLNSMVTVEAELLEQLHNDPDSRVRMGVVQAWKKHGKRGVERIVTFLEDPEAVVVTGAAQSLRFHFEDSPMAVKHLSESLSHRDSAYSSALALQSFGVEAQIAIPQLIRSLPLGLGYDFSLNSNTDLLSKVLSHIGPPRIEDLESFRQLLTDADPNTSALAARLIGQLGTQAESVAPLLEDLFQSSLLEHVKINAQASLIGDEIKRERFLWKNRGPETLCHATCSAYWRVSRNTERFVQLMEQLATQGESKIYFVDSPVTEFLEQDIAFLQRMLDSPNLHVRETVAHAILYDLPNGFISLEVLSTLRKLGQLHGYTLQSLARNRIRDVTPQFLSWLIEDLEGELFTLQDFAEAIASLRTGSARVETILTDGLESQDRYARNSCLKGLAAIASDDQTSVRILLSNAAKDPEFRRTSLETLLKQRRASELAFLFATDCLTDPEPWVRHYAISLLARIGPAASTSVPELLKLAKYTAMSSKNGGNKETELHLAMAVACISGDKSEFKRHFDLAMSDRTDDGGWGRSRILGLLKELGPDGDSFMDDISVQIQFASTHRENDESTLELGLELLGVIGSPRSIELLKTFEFDRDWQVRGKVHRILKMIDTGVEFKYDTYIP